MKAYLNAFPNTGDLKLIADLGFKGLRFDVRSKEEALAIRNLAHHPTLTPLAIVDTNPLAIRVAEEIAHLGRGAIELVNEPNLNDWKPEDWASFTTQAYPAIKAEELHHVTIPVVSGGVSNLNHDQVNYWHKALAAGLKFDVFGWHRYRTESPPSTPLKDYSSRAAEFAVVAALAGGKPAWCTETGWHDHRWWTPTEVAKFAVEEFRIQQAAGVPVMTWYQITDGPDRTDPEQCFGIRTINGVLKPNALVWKEL